MSIISRLFSGRRDQTFGGAIRIGGTQYNAQWSHTRVINSVYRNPTGYRCIEKNAYEFMRPEFAMFDKANDHKQLENDPFLNVLEMPFEKTTGTRMQYHISRDLDLNGGTFLLKMRGKDFFGLDGPITGLKRIPPQRVTVITGDDDELLGFIYIDRKGVRAPLLPDEVVYINFPDPEREWDRCAPAVVAGLPAEVDMAGMKFNAELLANDAALPGYLVVEGLSPDQFSKWTAAWRAGETAGKTRVLSSQSSAGGGRGNASYVRVGQSNQELAYDRLREMSREDMCRALGPPKVLIDPTDATFANVGEAKRMYVVGHTLPRWVWVRDSMTVQLRDEIGDNHEVGFNLDDIEELSKNLDAIVARNVQLLDRKVITINQFLEDLGMPPVACGDAPPDEPPEPTTNPDKADPLAIANTPPALGENTDKGRVVIDTKAIAAAKWLKTFHKAVEGHEKSAQKAMKSILLEQGEAIAKRIASKKGKAIRKAVEDWWDGERWNTEMAEVIGKELTATVGAVGDLALSTFVPGSDFDATSKRVTKYLSTRSEEIASLVNNTTKEEIRGVIGQIANDGGSVDDMVSAVREAFTDSSTMRAERFARTEMIGAANWAGEEAAKQSGIVSAKTWSASSTAEADCAALDGTTVPIGDSFGEVAAPPLHPNCRCTLLFEIDEEA